MVDVCIQEHKQGAQILQFFGCFIKTMYGSRKYPYPPTEGICPMTPPPLGKFQSVLWGKYGYFLEPHNIPLALVGYETKIPEDCRGRSEDVST